HIPPPTPPYTLSLHDALPICPDQPLGHDGDDAATERGLSPARATCPAQPPWLRRLSHYLSGRALADRSAGLRAGVPSPPETLVRSEEHTSELQSRSDLVCRLL